jgi:uncharacterized protein YqjF (DUF2071 family)
MGTFLTAEWRKLAIANYVVDPALLLPYLPAKTVLDLWEGKCYVSLVGFMFVNTRLKGIPIPFHQNFEEVNLRFYVKYNDPKEGWKRGVVFIKEIVPKAMITFVANTVYKEHYETLKMRHSWVEAEGELTVDYGWKSDDWQRFQVTTKSQPVPIPKASEDDFITDHFWGYTKQGPNKTAEYPVEHPSWEVYPMLSHKIEVDFGRVYGADFEELNQMTPVSVLLAEGSEISVGSGRTL